MDDEFQLGPHRLDAEIYKNLFESRSIFLLGDIHVQSAATLAAQLLWLNAIKQDEITVYINSQGGDIDSGLFTIYDTIQWITSPVSTVCIGEAYSSAGYILASGTRGKRYAYPHSKIMIHGVQTSELSGTQEEIEAESKRIKLLNQSLMELVARHSKQTLSKVKRDFKKDKYFTAEEALKYGLIDEVIEPTKKIPPLKR